MATIGGIVERVEEMLYGMAEIERPPEDVATKAAEGSTSVTAVGYFNMWGKDDYMEQVPAAGAVGEIAIVTTDPTTSTVAIRPAQRGTTGAAWSAGSVIRKNPKYSRIAIDNAVKDVCRIDLSQSQGVYYHTIRTLSFVEGDRLYDLDADDFDIVRMYQVIDDEEYVIGHGAGGWDVRQLFDTTNSTAGKAIRLYQVRDIASTVYYVARTKVAYANLADFPDELESIIPWFVCARLLGGTRTAANRYQPNVQGFGEVQDGGPGRDWRFFLNAAQRDLNTYTRQLMAVETEIRTPRFRRNPGRKPWLVRT